MAAKPDENPIALMFSPDAGTWPESGSAESAHDPVEFPNLDAYLRFVEAIGGMEPRQRQAFEEWAPICCWFEPDVEGEAPVLLCPVMWPRKGIILHGEVAAGVGFAAFVRVGEWWLLLGTTLLGQWPGLRRTCRRPVPYMAYAGVVDSGQLPDPQWRN